MKTELKINGMTCNNCVRHVKEALEGVGGVTNASVDLSAGKAVVEHDETTPPQQLAAAVQEEGYDASISQD